MSDREKENQAFLDSLPEGMAAEIMTMKCWLCGTPIGEKKDDDEPDEWPNDFPICYDCAGKELYPREHVCGLMRGLQATNRSTRRRHLRVLAEIERLKDPSTILREAAGIIDARQGRHGVTGVEAIYRLADQLDGESPAPRCQWRGCLEPSVDGDEFCAPHKEAMDAPF